MGDDALSDEAEITREPALAIRFLKSFWQLVAGAFCIAGGAAAIYLGWYGAAHTRDVTDQIPYAISGGLLGVAMIVLGGSFYFSFYVSRLHSATRRQAAALEAAVARLESLPGPARMHAVPEGTYLVAAGAKRFHRPDCSLLAGKEASPVGAGEAALRGLRPCKVCEPAA